MFKWLHHLLNPHCPDCKLERTESTICNSCETLKYEIDRLRVENHQLLDRLLNPPQVEERTIAPEPTTTLPPRRMPWAVRRQMLEEEDRARARALSTAAKPDTTSTEDLERELNLAEKERENVSGKS